MSGPLGRLISRPGESSIFWFYQHGGGGERIQSPFQAVDEIASEKETRVLLMLCQVSLPEERTLYPLYLQTLQPETSQQTPGSSEGWTYVKQRRDILPTLLLFGLLLPVLVKVPVKPRWMQQVQDLAFTPASPNRLPHGFIDNLKEIHDDCFDVMGK